MKRIQIAMWIDGHSRCEYCKAAYQSVDDFIARNPKKGYTEGLSFVDDICWDSYVKAKQNDG